MEPDSWRVLNFESTRQMLAILRHAVRQFWVGYFYTAEAQSGLYNANADQQRRKGVDNLVVKMSSYCHYALMEALTILHIK